MVEEISKKTIEYSGLAYEKQTKFRMVEKNHSYKTPFNDTVKVGDGILVEDEVPPDVFAKMEQYAKGMLDIKYILPERAIYADNKSDRYNYTNDSGQKDGAVEAFVKNNMLVIKMSNIFISQGLESIMRKCYNQFAVIDGYTGTVYTIQDPKTTITEAVNEKIKKTKLTDKALIDFGLGLATFVNNVRFNNNVTVYNPEDGNSEFSSKKCNRELNWINSIYDLFPHEYLTMECNSEYYKF